MNLLSPELIVSAFVARMAIKKLTHLESEVVLGTALYFTGLTTARLLTSTAKLGVRGYRWGRGLAVPQLPHHITEVNSVLDINSAYRLNGLEVVLGFDHTRRPVRVNLDAYHTLIAGASGAGKTNTLNWIISQLVSRPGFSQEYDLYLIDLKGSRFDYLSMWKPVIRQYWSLDPLGSSGSAIEGLRDIVERMHREAGGKKKVVIIDEVANLTSQSTDPELKKHGFAILQRLSAQLRDVGALVAATQRPHFQTIERGVTANLERKVCLRVDDRRDARLTLRYEPKLDCRNLRDGEFVVKEPRRDEQTARNMFVRLPGDIDQVVGRIIQINESTDERLTIFKLAAGSLNVGDMLPGVNRDFWKNGYRVELLRTAYKNYAYAGAIVPHVDRRKQPNQYKLAMEYGLAQRRVLEYIQEGRWQAAPETIRE